MRTRHRIDRRRSRYREAYAGIPRGINAANKNLIRECQDLVKFAKDVHPLEDTLLDYGSIFASQDDAHDSDRAEIDRMVHAYSIHVKRIDALVRGIVNGMNEYVGYHDPSRSKDRYRKDRHSILYR